MKIQYQYVSVTGKTKTYSSKEVLTNIIRNLKERYPAEDFTDLGVLKFFEPVISAIIKKNGLKRQFVAEDGSVFEDKQKALRYEEMLSSIHKEMESLGERHPGVIAGRGWQEHDPYLVNQVKKNVLSHLKAYDSTHLLLMMKNDESSNARSNEVIEGGAKHYRFLLNLLEAKQISRPLCKMFYRLICIKEGKEFRDPRAFRFEDHPRYEEQKFPVKEAVSEPYQAKPVGIGTRVSGGGIVGGIDTSGRMLRN